MDPTTQAFLAALMGALVAGGAVLAWHVSERQQQAIPSGEAPLIPPEVTTVLSVLRSSAVLLDESGTVVRASAPAYALGLVQDKSLVIEELAALVALVRRDGQIRETEMTIARPHLPPRTVSARVAPLGTRLVLALVEDRTRERQIEAVRRDFVANVSHELKTPVGAIRLLAETVGAAADDPDAVQHFAARMQHESDRLSKLVQQIIDLSRLQAGDAIEEPTLVSVDRVVEAAADTSATDAAVRGITLVTGGTPGLAVTGSEQQIISAVSNLITNAVAYSSAGSRVAVTTRATDLTVEISVIDQGIGIAPEEVGRLFERFYRVDPARHRSTGGTGLGLSIVKHVAASHGGDVTVWSVEGEGSTFTLTLPLTGGTPHQEERP